MIHYLDLYGDIQQDPILQDYTDLLAGELGRIRELLIELRNGKV